MKMDDFQTWLSNQDCAELTRKGYMTDLTILARWFEQTNGESLTPQSLTSTKVDEYRQRMEEVGLRASTINRHMAAISAYARWALSTGQISNDSTLLHSKTIKIESAPPKWLDKTEQDALRQTIENDLRLSLLRYPKRWVTRRRDASIALFLLNTGLHLSELVAMRLADVQVSDDKGLLLVQKGKSGNRSIPLNAEARKALQDWLAVRPSVDSDLVWVGVEGTSSGLIPRTMQRILERYAEEAGLKNLSVQVIRHTFAKNLIDAGVGLERVAALLGHNSLNTTLIYFVSGAHDLAQAVEKLGKPKNNPHTEVKNG